jgi:formate dehydrogenase gamma subunit
MTQKKFVRFNIPERVEHWILFLSFTTLAVTGLPQKFSSAGISQSLIVALGGIETIRIIHRIAATIFVLQSIYHFVIVGYKLYVRRVAPTMLPGVKDAVDAFQVATHNLGFRKEAPKMGRYNFTEKAEYWAMMWGLVMMALTGFMLWNPILTTRYLPGVIIPTAKVAHGWEAVLAVAAIIIWHFYNVHLKSLNMAMFNGKLSANQMEEEHGQELENIETGKAANPVIPEPVLHRRKLIYFPIATVIALAMTFGLYLLVTAESTATVTIPAPDEGVPVFSPQTPTPAPTETMTPVPPTPVPGATEASTTTWDGGINKIFADNCGSCHSSSGMGGLSVDDYASIMKGSSNGAVIVPGDPGNSVLVQVQQKGNHSGSFSDEDLKEVIDWIKAGAPEK